MDVYDGPATIAEAYATPKGASPEQAALCQDLRELFSKMGVGSPGYPAFRVGDAFSYDAANPVHSTLVLFYEGSDIQHLFAYEYASLDSYQGMEVMNDFLSDRGWYHEQFNSVCGAFYRTNGGKR